MYYRRYFSDSRVTCVTENSVLLYKDNAPTGEQLSLEFPKGLC